jgi:hypothetical protein
MTEGQHGVDLISRSPKYRLFGDDLNSRYDSFVSTAAQGQLR